VNTHEWPESWREVEYEYLPDRDAIRVSVVVDAAALVSDDDVARASIEIARHATSAAGDVARARKVVGAFSGVVNEAVRDVLLEECAELRAEVAELKAKLEVMREAKNAIANERADVADENKGYEALFDGLLKERDAARAEVAELLAERARLGELLAAARSQFFGQYDED
jgi:outer membrane murein-binding lipoprotein Lpp